MPRSLLLAASTLVIACAAPVAHAWEFTATPYLWFASLDAHMAVDPSLPTVHLEESFSDIVNEAQLAFAAKLEAREGRLGLIGEINYADTGTSSTLSAPFTSAQLDSTTVLIAGAAALRVFDNGDATADILGGVRATYTETDLTIGAVSGGVLGGDTDAFWGDAYLGARGSLNLSEHWSLSAYADAGAGYSDFTWQAFAGVDWKVGSLVLSGGYRIYADDYDDDGFIYDIVEDGPIIGASFTF